MQTVKGRNQAESEFCSVGIVCWRKPVYDIGQYPQLTTVEMLPVLTCRYVFGARGTDVYVFGAMGAELQYVLGVRGVEVYVLGARGAKVYVGDQGS